MTAQPALSSFLIEFDQPVAGMSRMQRNELNEQQVEQIITAKRAQVSQQHADFQSALTNDLQVPFQVRHEFFDLLNGISIDLQDVAPSNIPTILDKIKALSGVIKASPLVSLSQPKMIVHNVGMKAMTLPPQLSNSHEQTGVLKARNELGLKGKGIKVGVIDTGVDYTHPALGECYGKGCKVAYGYDFVDGPYGDAPGGFDCVGHGTHVAGIIAANSAEDGFYGVAPEVTLGSYRVFPCNGNTKDDVIIAALEKAYQDRMDVVNLSLGGGSAWGESSLAKVAGTLSKLGVVVVAAIGNDGDDGFSEVSSPSVNKDSFSVASFEGPGYLSYHFTQINSNTRYVISDRPPSSLCNIPLPLEIAKHDPEGCKPYPFSVQGKMVLIKRGNCTFIEKVKLAQAAGAIGCIFYNNVAGGFHPLVEDSQVNIPSFAISQQQGQNLLQEYSHANGDLKIEYSDNLDFFDNPTAGQISAFSSWGLGPELELKPDIGAPGGYIYSTVPVDKGSYSTMSGTSMATPFVAGTVALLLESNPDIDRTKVLGHMQSYANPGMYMSENVPDTVVHQGAGLVNVYAAIQGKATVQPARIAWNDTDHRPEAVILTLTNHYETEELFELSHRPAMSVLGYTQGGVPSSAIEYRAKFADLSINETRARLGPGEQATFSLTFTGPPSVDFDRHCLFSGYIQIKPTLDPSRPLLRIPYAGMHGSYSSLDVLDLSEGFPVLLGSDKDGIAQPLRSPTGGASTQGSPTVFTMRGRDYPTLLLKISNPIRGLRIFVMDHEKDAVIGEVPTGGSFLGRTDSIHTSYFSLPWIGRIINSAGHLLYLPDGVYSFVVIGPKPFADQQAFKPSEYESWSSPAIAIRR
ncbi:hypothetical protein DFQ26_001596 [Actinomortierella ambigua]|nr:hypothetical protein DFQ26_001596 [Actinomortierella ambigua]